MPNTMFADVSGGIQSATNWKLRQGKELEDALNVRFGKKIGSAVRRDGHVEFKDTDGTAALGYFEAKFKEETIWFMATTVSSNTVIKAYRPQTDAFSDVITGLPANLNVTFEFHLNEVYMAGITDSGTRIQPYNIRLVSGVITTSQTRNLITAPKAAYVKARGGKLYLGNVETTAVYPDRVYESSPPMGAVTYIQAAQTLYSSDGSTLNSTDADSTSNSIRLDSVRYVKPGMAVDIYAAGTSTKTYDLVVGTVNNSKDTVTFSSGITPNVVTVAQSGTTVNTTTEVITVPSNAWMVTGTPITYTSATPIAGLVSGSTYYVINVSSTTIKLAATPALATAGTAINLTSTGSGNGYFSARYSFADNDEVWLDGRKSELSVLWNTDYRTEQTADYLQIPTGSAADTSVVGLANSNNRLVLFTRTSLMDYDGAQLKPVFQEIGLVNTNAMVNSLEWLIWVDSDMNVHARDSTSGAHEVISRGVKELFSRVDPAYYSKITMGMIDNILKINVGTIDEQLSRYIYDFDLNAWSRDTYTRNLRFTINSRISGKNRMYALTDTMTIYREDEGNNDAGDVIPFMVQYGQRDYGTSFSKGLKGLFVIGSSISGANIQVARPPKNVKTEFSTIGQLTEPVTKIAIGDTRNLNDHSFNVRISHASDGEAQVIDVLDMHYELQETTFGG